MKTNESNVLETFTFSKLPNKLTTVGLFSVLPQILCQPNTAHFQKGEMAFYYSLKSAIQLSPKVVRSGAFCAPVSCYSMEPFNDGSDKLIQNVLIN